jgi:hypothetical protein
MIEVPDFAAPMRAGDASELWEEHVNYFTEPVLTWLLSQFSFETEEVRRYPFCGGAMTVAARLAPDAPAPSPDSRAVAEVSALAAGYGARIEAFRRNLVGILERNTREGVANVLYGPGCRACSVVNCLDLGRHFSFAVDDQKEKQGLFMPGARLPIRPAEAIHERKAACFLSVNHENEDKVVARHAEFVKRGGVFHSLNSPSPRFLSILGA